MRGGKKSTPLRYNSEAFLLVRILYVKLIRVIDDIVVVEEEGMRRLTDRSAHSCLGLRNLPWQTLLYGCV